MKKKGSHLINTRAIYIGRIDKIVTREVVAADRLEAYREFFRKYYPREEEASAKIPQKLEQEKAYDGEGFIRKLQELLGINLEYRRRGQPKNK